MEMSESPQAVTITNAGRVFDDAMLADFADYQDLAIALDNLGIPTETIADYGTGFVLTPKAALIGVPFLIAQWRFNPGKYGEEFVSVEAVTKHNEKVIFNDGSTGVARQLRAVTDTRNKRKHPAPQAGLVVPGGLTKTEYWYNEVTRETSSVPQTGKGWGPAETYYLAG